MQRDNDGRRVIVNLALNCVLYRLINVYGSNHAPTRKAFIASMATWVGTSRRLIVGGDFDFIEKPSLDKQGGNINALANRLRSVLEDIIHPDQTCSIPGRSTADNLHLIHNIYDCCKYRNAACFLTSFDSNESL